MSKGVKGLVKRKGQADYGYDFILQGNRFCGRMEGVTNRREAEKRLAKIRADKIAELAQFDGVERMTFHIAANRWWMERGGYRKDEKDVRRFLQWLSAHIGNATLIDEIDNSMVAKLVTLRRQDDITAATLNRSLVEPLKAVLNYAKLMGHPIKTIDWRAHKMKEIPKAIRELTADDEARLMAHLREDLHPIFRFLIVTGLRRSEACNLRWRDVNMETENVTVHAKGGQVDCRPLSKAAVAILRAEQGNNAEFVFTYATHDTHGKPTGGRVKLEPNTLHTFWWRAKLAAGMREVRLHDLRHTALTRITRKGGIDAARAAAGHKSIEMTSRYAHLNAEDVRAALDAAFPVVAVVPARKIDG